MIHSLLKGGVLAASALLLAHCGGSETTTADDTAAETAPAVDTGPSEAELEIEAKMAMLPAPYSEANYRRGRSQFTKCRSCHLLNPDGGNRIGPNLYGMFGRQVGMLEGFTYSDVLIEAGFDWTPELLDEWLANPRDFLPGNLMTFVGVSNEAQRVDLIAYLMVETAEGGMPDFGVAPAAEDASAETPEAAAEPETTTP